MAHSHKKDSNKKTVHTSNKNFTYLKIPAKQYMDNKECTNKEIDY